MECNKPAFNNAAYWDELFDFTLGREDRAAMQAANHVWGKFVTPLQSEIASQLEQIENMTSVMIAAAEEIQEHWEAHCDEDGYGPANLLVILGNIEHVWFDATCPSINNLNKFKQ